MQTSALKLQEMKLLVLYLYFAKPQCFYAHFDLCWGIINDMVLTNTQHMELEPLCSVGYTMYRKSFLYCPLKHNKPRFVGWPVVYIFFISIYKSKRKWNQNPIQTRGGRIIAEIAPNISPFSSLSFIKNNPLRNENDIPH